MVSTTILIKMNQHLARIALQVSSLIARNSVTYLPIPVQKNIFYNTWIEGPNLEKFILFFDIAKIKVHQESHHGLINLN